MKFFRIISKNISVYKKCCNSCYFYRVVCESVFDKDLGNRMTQRFSIMLLRLASLLANDQYLSVSVENLNSKGVNFSNLFWTNVTALTWHVLGTFEIRSQFAFVFKKNRLSCYIIILDRKNLTLFCFCVVVLFVVVYWSKEDADLDKLNLVKIWLWRFGIMHETILTIATAASTNVACFKSGQS